MPVATPWLLHVDGADSDWFCRQLSDTERTASRTIRSPRRRIEFAASRVLAKVAGDETRRLGERSGRWQLIDSAHLRSVTGETAGSEWIVTGSATTTGPPALYNPRSGEINHGLSIAHRWPFVAVSVTHGRPCGVDVERYGSVSAALQALFLPEAQELAAILPALDDAEWRTLFWTIKEAAFKACRFDSRSAALRDIRIDRLQLASVGDDRTAFDFTALVRFGRTVEPARIQSARFPHIMCSQVTL